MTNSVIIGHTQWQSKQTELGKNRHLRVTMFTLDYATVIFSLSSKTKLRNTAFAFIYYLANYQWFYFVFYQHLLYSGTHCLICVYFLYTHAPWACYWIENEWINVYLWRLFLSNVRYIVHSSQLVARLIINYLLTYLLSFCIYDSTRSYIRIHD